MQAPTPAAWVEPFPGFRFRCSKTYNFLRLKDSPWVGPQEEIFFVGYNVM